jgi:hypothetical protein
MNCKTESCALDCLSSSTQTEKKQSLEQGAGTLARASYGFQQWEKTATEDMGREFEDLSMTIEGWSRFVPTSLFLSRGESLKDSSQFVAIGNARICYYQEKGWI